MNAVVMHAFGGPEVLRTEEWPVPQPKDNEVLIKVSAAGVNPVDYKIRSGAFMRDEIKLPSIPGRDVAGIVEAVGRDIRGLKEGDEVYAFLASHAGGYASHAIAQEHEVALKPSTIDFAHAAAVPLAAVTAWQALFEYGGLQPKQRVLIHGGGGGVGLFAIQFAKAKGATVIVTASPEDLSLVKKLGADQVIDYKHEQFETLTDPVDLVVDLVAGDTQRRSWAVLKEDGAMVSTLEQPSKEEAEKRHARAKVFFAKPSRKILTDIAHLIDQKKVFVVIQKTYSLEDAALAQKELERDHSRGKRVLVVT